MPGYDLRVGYVHQVPLRVGMYTRYLSGWVSRTTVVLRVGIPYYRGPQGGVCAPGIPPSLGECVLFIPPSLGE